MDREAVSSARAEMRRAQQARLRAIIAITTALVLVAVGSWMWGWSQAQTAQQAQSQAQQADTQRDTAQDHAAAEQAQTQRLAQGVATSDACKKGPVMSGGIDLCKVAAAVASQRDDTPGVPDTPAERVPAAVVRQLVTDFCARGGCQSPQPSPADVARAVAEHCKTAECPWLQPPRDAGHRGLTDEQLASAVKAFCSTGACRGSQGEEGKPGKDGEDGESQPPAKNGADGKDGGPGAQGMTGPGPTDAQVLAAARTLCSTTDLCRGPAGPAGAEGKPGPAGRGVASITCGADGTWQVSMTDGTTQTVSGPCRVEQPAPAPSPTPEPTPGPAPTPTGG